MDAEMMGDGWSMELIERDHKISAIVSRQEM